MTFMSNTKENILKNVFVLTIKLNVSNVVLDLTGFHYLKKNTVLPNVFSALHNNEGHTGMDHHESK